MKMGDSVELRICRSAFFESLEAANNAFAEPGLFAELRFDLSSFSLPDLKKLQQPEKLIFTCRKGRFSEEERMDAYTIALELGIAFIDLDFETDGELLNKLKPFLNGSSTALILSQHNFRETPSLDALKRSIRTAFDLGADYAKIITTARHSDDLRTIYSLYNQEVVGRLVAFAMGELGAETRVKNLFLGAPFTYAAFSQKEKTAPGQLDLQQTIEWYSNLKQEEGL